MSCLAKCWRKNSFSGEHVELGFVFAGHSLTRFVKHCAEHFLSSDHKGVRLEAVVTCAKLLTPSLNVSVSFVHSVRGLESLSPGNTQACPFSVVGESARQRKHDDDEHRGRRAEQTSRCWHHRSGSVKFELFAW